MLLLIAILSVLSEFVAKCFVVINMPLKVLCGWSMAVFSGDSDLKIVGFLPAFFLSSYSAHCLLSPFCHPSIFFAVLFFFFVLIFEFFQALVLLFAFHNKEM